MESLDHISIKFDGMRLILKMNIKQLISREVHQQTNIRMNKLRNKNRDNYFLPSDFSGGNMFCKLCPTATLETIITSRVRKKEERKKRRKEG